MKRPPKIPPKNRKPEPPPEKPPRNIFKRILLVGAAGSFFAVIGLAWYISTLDMDSLREPIASIISQQTGTKVEIAGLDVDFTQGLGLRASGLKVATADGKRDLFSADSLFLQAKLAPLLYGKFEVKKTSLIKPIVNLYLDEPEEKKERPEKHLTQEQFKVETVRSALRKIDLTVDIIEIQQGQVYLFSPGKRRPEKLSVSLNLKLQRPGPEEINALIEDIDLRLNNLHFTGSAGAFDILSETGTVEVAFQLDPFSSSDLDRVFKMLPASARNIISQYPFSGKFNKLTAQVRTPLDSLENLDDLIKQAQLNLSLDIDNFSLKTKGAKLFLDHLEVENTWADGVLSHKIKAAYLGGEVLLQGKMIMEGSGENISPFIDTKLQMVNVDVAALQFKEDWFPAGGKISGAFKVHGPIRQLEKIELDGSFTSQNLSLNPPKANPKTKVSFPKLDGNIKWAHGTIHHDIQGQTFGADFFVKGVLRLQKAGAKTVMVIDSNIKVVNLNLGQVKPLAPSKFFPGQGSLSTDFNLSGPLTDIGKIRWKGKIQGRQIVINTPQKGFSQVSVPRIDIEADWSNGRLIHDVKGQALGGDFSVKGSLDFQKKRGKTLPEIHSDFVIKNIDLKPLKPLVPIDWFPAEGMISTQFNLSGPLQNFDRLRWDGQIKADRLLFNPAKGTAVSNIFIPHMDIKATWANRKLKHDIRGDLFDGSIRIQGSAGIGKDSQGNSSIDIQSNVSLNNLNFARAKLPWEWAPSEGTLSGSLNLSGTSAKGKAVMLNGNLTARKVVLTPGKQRYAIERIDINAKSRSKNLTTINLNLNNILFNNIALKKVTAALNLTPDAIVVTRGALSPAHGEVLIKGDYQLSAKTYKFNLQGKGLRIEDFANKEEITSPLRFTGTLHGRVPDHEPATRGLNGAIKITAGKGIFHKFKIAQGILTLLNPTSAFQFNKEGLAFDYMGGDVKITKGVLSSKNLAMEGPQMKIYMRGTADLTTQKLNINGEARPLQMLDAVLKSIPILGDILSGGSKGGIIKTPFTVRGTFSDPKVSAGLR
ncbi:MAG: AsmA-like C-terminal domain-containing protein [Nitrospinae bacterium]|nr:AsmA-like C-terminal domain-containing protein [Nitrospinota bacterium]